ncbi:endonuclease/exonuclease/phosphatase family protein [Nocardioides mangrovi]|uniref:Endonuclease/exonuclease/phosphatase domain-containing protein n=1 Tax=Nocardioides mangrovi TaxID=2874580 RepID=A0ABS7U8J0_9ACTN|nr:endonuclease/exonuclease/phosphatase family protein [Nocardioides mangrovi]MBZ5737299.1 hypothetical protein [Nocardioides mangrovi]
MGSNTPWRRRVATAGAVLAMLVGTAVGTAPIAQADKRAGGNGSDPGTDPVADVTMVQANIYTGLTVERFQKDVATVLGLQPDFVTYNEVPFRSDAVMAPTGYSIYRDMTDRFTAATPVAWRTDRWTALDEGSFMISNWRGKPPGKQVELGRRWANWVTLQGVDGRVVSVVSAHIAPLTKGMPDLLDRSMKRLGMLVSRLAPSGPVLVGGDFNVHYTSGRYPRDIVAADGLVPTYDSLGAYFPTGDHHGNTIDYIFGSQPEVLAPVLQYPVELRSDHDAVVAGLTWATDPPTDTTVFGNQPGGDATAQRAVLTELSGAIRAAEPGSTVRFATPQFALGGLLKASKKAVARGVHVRVTTANNHPTVQQQRLARALANSGDPDSWLHACPASCVKKWRAANVPHSLLMVSDATGAWQTRYDISRKLTQDLVLKKSTVSVNVGPLALNQGVSMLRVIG